MIFRFLAIYLSLGIALAFGGASPDLRVYIVGADRADPAHAALVAGARAAAAAARQDLSLHIAVHDLTQRAMTAHQQADALTPVVEAGRVGLILVPHRELDWVPYVDVLRMSGGAVAWIGVDRDGANAAALRQAETRLDEAIATLEGSPRAHSSPYYRVISADSGDESITDGIALGLQPSWTPALRSGSLTAAVQPDVFGAGFEAVRSLGLALGDERLPHLDAPAVPLMFRPDDADSLEALWLDWLR